MPKLLCYRRRLLNVVNAYLDPADCSHVRADRLIDRLYHDHFRRNSHTINDLVWGGFVQKLTDSEFSESREYLQQTRDALAHGSPELHRAYLNYDFRPDFTDVEHDWHAQLCDLAAWLQAKPFPWLQSGPLPADGEVGAQTEYERRVTAITELSAQSPPPNYVGEEKLYHFVMRTASAVLTGINPRYSMRCGYLTAGGEYTAYHWNPAAPADRYKPIDARMSIDWAARALRAITLQDWLWITWQITATSYLVSLH